MTPAFRCSDAARERGDTPLGTAPVTAAYLLIEHPGPWRFDALAGAGWPDEVTQALGRAVRRSRGRLLLIRRPGRRSTNPVRRWAVSRVGGQTRWESWRDPEELLHAAEALESAEALERAQEPKGAQALEAADGQAPLHVSERLLLVCTHGVHDTCCAIRGRPVAAALARRWPEETWECSHVGGDRFAANVIVLPDGIYYGALDDTSVTETIEGHLAGHLDLDHLRGSVRWPPVAQVAVGAVQRQLELTGLDDVWPEHWVERGTGSWFVEGATVDGRRFGVRLTVGKSSRALLTCAAHQATSAATYRIDDVAVSGPTSTPH